MKDHNVEQFENYLSGDMAPEEKLRFEAGLKEDKELYDLFHLYKTIDAEMYNTGKYSTGEAALKSTLQKLNAVYFKPEAPVMQMKKNKKRFRIAVAAAAGVILILTAYFYFFQKATDPRQLANRYVKEELLHLSITMDGAKDSLQQGIAAYNDSAYARAVQLFEAVYKAHPGNSDALKYAGTTYLVTKEYNKALQCFDELAAKKGLFSNSGTFLKAVTLLQRNQPGDKEQATQLLQQVVNEKADGSKEAERWLRK
ncbi:tetratricopeptide repeat protein [Agriterribacter sp.]|uniref:tetratricopeptide repeat protein n=1 Tax=Agriterribacter sp. TaxID=2821509 RepID=UPI002B63DD45|nr:tetratricopeptide repeat protein [Agriterribacter sp.]HRP55936.1 tetratricopeptide repeat protein [Agriterribacter sp.]